MVKSKTKKKTQPGWLGWLFADATECLRYGDGRKIKVGITHKVECDPVLCERGLHASKTVIDALQYAPGNILFRVRLGGKIVRGDDKSVATERKYISRLNAEPALREFARKCALTVIHLWDCPRIVQDYLETGEEKTRTAARAAAGAAAGVAAGAAAGDAAGAAAGAAARDAAWAAAGDAAGAAAWAAAWAKQTVLLEKMINAAIRKQRRLK